MKLIDRLLCDQIGLDPSMLGPAIVERTGRTRALRRLERLLDNQGILFNGAAELPLVVNHGFASANLPMAFACRKKEAHRTASTSHPGVVPTLTAFTIPVAGDLPPTIEPEAIRARSRPTPATARRAVPSADETLLLARQLADAGQLREAPAVCEGYLREHGPSARAHDLLGLLADTQDLAGADESYRRALYLDPNHYEALVRMALLYEKRGESPRARTQNQRAERIAQQT